MQIDGLGMSGVDKWIKASNTITSNEHKQQETMQLEEVAQKDKQTSLSGRFDSFTKTTEISRMHYADGSFDFSLPEDAAQRNVDIWEGQTKEIIISLSPEGKRYKAMIQMSDERNAFIEQMKADISASRMDYFESQRFVEESFTDLYTDWMYNKPELFKVYFDRNEDRFANHEWNLISKPNGWTDADFEYWKNYDPWGLEK